MTSKQTLAQIRKIPASVTDAFNSKYDGATGVEWRDKLTGFVATFNLNNVSYQASFNNKGEWESTEQEIDQDNLPEVVKDSRSKSKYADWDVIKVDKIELPNNQFQYRIEVGKGDIKKETFILMKKAGC